MIFLVNLDLKKLDIHDGCLLLLITNKAWPAERPLAPPGPFTGVQVFRGELFKVKVSG